MGKGVEFFYRATVVNHYAGQFHTGADGIGLAGHE